MWQSALRPGYVPGQIGFDPLGFAPEDPAEFRTMQEKELSHCRLAMIAAAGFLAQEAVTGQTWAAEDTMFENLLLGGWFASPGARDKAAEQREAERVQSGTYGP